MKPFSVLPALMLTACGSITPAGLIAVSALDPLNTPPGDVQLALSVPEAVRLAEDGATLRITFTEEDQVLIDTTAPLTITQGAPESETLRQPDETLYVGRIDTPEAEAFAAAQAEIRSLRASGSEGTGSLSISVTKGCRVGPPLQEMPVSTWIRTNPNAGFVPLTRQRDVLDELTEHGGPLPAC
ncbi:hypothetical protein [Pacificoceanicola onchidii]|uniref:hypothetical protein n=1 Tax=Pacificoceanicola onchidii TaxID=2562685 RepID=UPI0010A61B79|nr:hypothetical protein [Pacificoceanicola onchidii]